MNIDLTTPKLVYKCRYFQNIGYKLRPGRYISDRRTTMAANAGVKAITFFDNDTVYFHFILIHFIIELFIVEN